MVAMAGWKSFIIVPRTSHIPSSETAAGRRTISLDCRTPRTAEEKAGLPVTQPSGWEVLALFRCPECRLICPPGSLLGNAHPASRDGSLELQPEVEGVGVYF